MDVNVAGQFAVAYTFHFSDTGRDVYAARYTSGGSLAGFTTIANSTSYRSSLPDPSSRRALAAARPSNILHLSEDVQLRRARERRPSRSPASRLRWTD